MPSIWSNPSPKTQPFTAQGNAAGAGLGNIPNFQIQGMQPGSQPVAQPSVAAPAKTWNEFIKAAVKTVTISHG